VLKPPLVSRASWAGIPEELALQSLISRINSQTKSLEILVKGKAGDVIKHMGYDDIGNGIAQGKLLVFREFLEHLCGCSPDGIVVMNDMKRRHDRIKKFYGNFEVCPVTKECDGFTDNIPSGIKRNGIVRAKVEQFACLFKIGVLGAKRCKEK